MNKNRIVFVMGCGRSGTHWLGHTLDSHPNIKATIEKPLIFNKVTRIALVPEEKSKLLPLLEKEYRKEIAYAASKIYVDKSHPSMWFAEDLAEIFSDALFIGIQRNPYATVASMIRHRGVTRWTEIWRQFPIPNHFLGIDEKIAEKYNDLSTATKHALRWKSHTIRMKELKKILGNHMHLILYENLHKSTANELNLLQSFLQLNKPFLTPQVKQHSLERWRNDLSEQDIIDIKSIIGKDFW